MNPITTDPTKVAYCGLYCGACNAFRKEKCPGCHDNSKATWCKIRTCNMEHGYSSCADCETCGDPNDCKLFNTVMSKLFALIFRSDRQACVMAIREKGLEEYANYMATNGLQSMKR